MTNLEWFYENDRRAFIDFVICNGECETCRAKGQCDKMADTDMSEVEWLLTEHEQ